ncbi:hypothetical protein BN7_776 [Wickerhamomyces ciferrii]|uniref:Uncharacterized protein n=1 Tax=Wickerhamomyces ciferrii (strain ATCC 14091 / BCRC 22168 / CBS 111 / JCM 3599 / NBRC 0793 / NRRL Y-1031 F-60-10) TaxID=1206466 RepID=K0KIM8_WICCF|nr:uncharacterized protein BN7_776 [Wickerhamomyces ciferrii]CCH41239.1 hypothetical protein BN7_776 [Wickerhamomyces ciferrii]
MIHKLPIELKLRLLDLQPRLKYTNREFYILHNELYKMKVFHLLGNVSLDKIFKLLKVFSSTLEFWNGSLTKLYKPDLNWIFIYSLLQNRKIFFQYQDFVIQENTNQNSTRVLTQKDDENEYIHIASAHAFHYHKITYLPNGNYNFQIALRNIKSSRGLGTTKFQLNYLNESITAYPPSIINEILPNDQLSVLNLGEFTIDNHENDLTEVEIIIEEIGMFPKTDIILDYLDFRPLHSDYLYYSLPGDPFKTYETFVNKIEKTCHLAIDDIWGKDVHAHLQEMFEEEEEEVDSSPDFPLTPPSDKLDQLVQYNYVLEESNLEDLKNYAKDFYTSSTRHVKMYFPSDQRHFREEHTGPLLEWRVPLLR